MPDNSTGRFDGSAAAPQRILSLFPRSEREIFRHVAALVPNLGEAEMGNRHATGFAGQDPCLIRNFSGTMDEFCLIGRTLAVDEIRARYADGKPQPDAVTGHRSELSWASAKPYAPSTKRAPHSSQFHCLTEKIV